MHLFPLLRSRLPCSLLCGSIPPGRAVNRIGRDVALRKRIL
jgi:hypothetical protein